MDAKFIGILSLLVVGNFIFVDSPLYMYMFVYAKTNKKRKSGFNYVFNRKATGFTVRLNYLNWTSLKENGITFPQMKTH